MRIAVKALDILLSAVFSADFNYFFTIKCGKTGADWDSAPEQTGTLLMLQS